MQSGQFYYAALDAFASFKTWKVLEIDVSGAKVATASPERCSLLVLGSAGPSSPSAALPEPETLPSAFENPVDGHGDNLDKVAMAHET